FGQLTDITECSELQLADMPDTGRLEEALFERYPGLRQARYLMTVNRKIVRERALLSENAEVALLPPFSGG
ncbi:MAG TPA: MoaD/ThiS family protein, partial [Anseongella sp.]|nr:MoaD/ThiS family protein [Anseongella sp.]